MDVGNVSALIDVVAESSLDGDIRRTTLADGADVKPDGFAEALTGLMGAEIAKIKARY